MAETASLSIILPAFNERDNICTIIESIIDLSLQYKLEIIVVDDDSPDGTSEVVLDLARQYSFIRLVRRVGRSGLSSAIKEGLLNACHEYALVMDCDGQHPTSVIKQSISHLRDKGLDLVVGSRFLQGSVINGLTNDRESASTFANFLAKKSISKRYRHLTDYMSGFFAVDLKQAMPIIRSVDVNGFKFLYELLAKSNGALLVGEVPLIFEKRLHGSSKLDIAVAWDFLLSFLHSISLKLIPRRAISFALVGLSGVFVQLFSVFILTNILAYSFQSSLPIAVILAATSYYLINNILTFRFARLNGLKLIKGLTKFLLVSSLPFVANIGLASAYYEHISSNELIAQLLGIIFAFTWNYVASSKFVWNTP